MRGLRLYSGAMVLLALNACSGQASGDASARASSSASNGAAWAVVEEPNGLRIEFPSAPKKQGGKGLAEGTATLEYSLSQGSSSYSVRESINPIYAAIKKDDYRDVVEGALKTKLKNYQDNDSGRLLSEKEVPLMVASARRSGLPSSARRRASTFVESLSRRAATTFSSPSLRTAIRRPIRSASSPHSSECLSGSMASSV